MDEAKKKKLDEMLQNLLERELSREKGTPPKPTHPGRSTGAGGSGPRVIRRRKGHPDKQVP